MVHHIKYHKKNSQYYGLVYKYKENKKKYIFLELYFALKKKLYIYNVSGCSGKGILQLFGNI